MQKRVCLHTLHESAPQPGPGDSVCGTRGKSKPTLGAWRGALAAHRGGAAHAPENSLVGFALAREHGATAIELDLQITRDNRCVLMHDLGVDRTTNGTGRVADLTLEGAKAERCNYMFCWSN